VDNVETKRRYRVTFDSEMERTTSGRRDKDASERRRDQATTRSREAMIARY